MSEKTVLVEKLIAGHGRDGRCVYFKRGKRELVEACLRPHVSVAKMAMRHGVNANLLRKWIVAYQAQLPRATGRIAARHSVAAKLLPVLQLEGSPLQRLSDGPPMLASAGDSSGYGIEIVMPNCTVRVRGVVDPRQLSTVLDCVAQLR